MMKACVLKDVKTFEVRDVPVPKLEDDEILLKVSACSICGSDPTMSGNAAYIGRIFGHELCGVVEDPNKSSFKAGDRLIMGTSSTRGCPGIRRDGGYAEYVAVEAAHMLPMPDNMSDRAGCMVEPLAIGYGSVLAANVKPGDKVLITGCGIIASMIAQWAKYMGASYIAMTEINDAKIARAKSIGTPAEFFKADEPDVIQKLMDASGGGFDACFDCPGTQQTIALCIEAAKPSSTIIEIAIHYTPVSFNYLKLVMKQLNFKGFYGSQPFFKDVIRILSEEKPFDPTMFISEEVDIDGIPQAIADLTAPGSDLLKIIIRKQEP